MSDEYANVDLLDRQDIVDSMKLLLKTVHENKSSCTFSLNGAWGVGKSFVMDMLREQLRENDEYVVFKYNCWQYDYYEEPLISIVSSIFDGVYNRNHSISNEDKETLNKIIVLIAKLSGKITDIDAKIRAVKWMKQIFKNESKDKIDTYDTFNSVLEKLKKELNKLYKKKTIVFIVDELDRCLPEYQIKVLERLHHLFDGVSNCAVILSIAKEQLECTVNQIFGTGEEKAGKYLEKFIDFELSLDKGNINNKFTEKFKAYYDMFDNHLGLPDFDFNEYFSALFGVYIIRTQEHIIKRIMTVHKMLFPNEKKDYSFMCFELLWAILKSREALKQSPLLKFTGNIFNVDNIKFEDFNKYMETNWKYEVKKTIYCEPINRPTSVNYTFISQFDIPQFLILHIDDMLKYIDPDYEKEIYKYERVEGVDSNILEENKQYAEDFKKFNDLLDIIKIE